ncbi:hypothetical protein BDZ97DRAFT_38446 [Flammula alnicola]|nr:hypothetical protein BDZ97DRAFT_38446 [Flammula alnicola]
MRWIHTPFNVVSCAYIWQSSGTEMDAPISSLLVLEHPLVPTEVRMDPLSSSHGPQITETGLETPEQQDNGDRVIQPRLDALNPPSGISLALVTSQRDSEISQADIIPGLSRVENEKDDSGCALNGAEQQSTPLIKDYLLELLDDNRPPTIASHSPDSLQTSHPDLLYTPPFRTSQNNSALHISSSSNLQVFSGLTHQVDVESCEQPPIPSIECFKSTGGRSDDILPRPNFDGEKESLETKTSPNHCINPENHSNIYHSPCPKISKAPCALSEKADDSESKPSEQDSSTSDASLTFRGQPEQSHEETGMTFVSDHLNIPSSSPIAYTEYSQSNPYFEPAIIFRAHSPHFRMEVVGTQNCPSSSPPSSPSMSSNYVPSSSPLPSSSPVGGSSQTPPSLSPATSDAYVQATMSGVGGQEVSGHRVNKWALTVN